MRLTRVTIGRKLRSHDALRALGKIDGKLSHTVTTIQKAANRCRSPRKVGWVDERKAPETNAGSALVGRLTYYA